MATRKSRPAPTVKSLTKKFAKQRWRALTLQQKETWLRTKATPSELHLHRMLDADPRTRGKFNFQKGVHGHFPDFSFPATKLIVELDGAVHCGAKARQLDAKRTKQLTNCGWKVIRFWNSELRNPSEVMEVICSAMQGPVIFDL
jgi:very-short-patch-repair endonuclease